MQVGHLPRSSFILVTVGRRLRYYKQQFTATNECVSKWVSKSSIIQSPRGSGRAGEWVNTVISGQATAIVSHSSALYTVLSSIRPLVKWVSRMQLVEQKKMRWISATRRITDTSYKAIRDVVSNVDHM